MARIYIEVPKQIANVSQRNDIPTRWRWSQDDQVTTRCLVSTHVISFTIGSKQMVRMIRFISHACFAKLPCHFHVFAYLHLPEFVRQLPYVLCNLQISSLSYAGALERVPRSAHNWYMTYRFTWHFAFHRDAVNRHYANWLCIKRYQPHKHWCGIPCSSQRCLR